MTDVKRGVGIALMITFVYAVVLINQVEALLVRNWHVFVYAPIVPGSKVTNLAAFGILLVSMFFVILIPIILLLRRVSRRQMGEMLDQSQRELRVGVPGLEQLRRRVER